MKTGHISDQDICLYVDALKLEKTGQLPQDIVAHVSDCVDCKRQIMQLYDALKAEDYQHIDGHPSLGAVKEARHVPARLIFRIAAAIVVLLAAGMIAYFAFLRNTHESGPPSHAASVDTSDASRKDNVEAAVPTAEKFAANFTPSPNLEDLVGSDFRAASVTVESPSNGQAVTGNIMFRWRANGTTAFKVRVLTNREKEVFQVTTDRHSVLYDKPLDPGLYYWMLLEDGELVHVGKFTVPVR